MPTAASTPRAATPHSTLGQNIAPCRIPGGPFVFSPQMAQALNALTFAAVAWQTASAPTRPLDNDLALTALLVNTAFHRANPGRHLGAVNAEFHHLLTVEHIDRDARADGPPPPDTPTLAKARATLFRLIDTPFDSTAERAYWTYVSASGFLGQLLLDRWSIPAPHASA